MNKQKTAQNYIPESIREAVEFDKTYFEIPVKESNEELVDIKKITKQEKIRAIFNNDLTATGKKRLFLLRRSLVAPLLAVIRDLEKQGLFLRFEYLYRHLEDQRAAFERSVNTFRKKYPKLAKKEILEIAGVFVAATPATAGHVSGAAIDVTLVDKQLKPVDMGVPYIHPGAESKTDHPGIPQTAKAYRMILVKAMEKYGFANYPYEYWHFSKGDKIAARIQNRKFAVFGPVIYNPKTMSTRAVQNAEKPFNTDHLFLKHKQ